MSGNICTHHTDVILDVGREKPKGQEWGLREGFRAWSDGKLSTDGRLPQWRSVLASLSLASDVAAFTVIVAVLKSMVSGEAVTGPNSDLPNYSFFEKTSAAY